MNLPELCQSGCFRSNVVLYSVVNCPCLPCVDRSLADEMLSTGIEETQGE